MNMSLLAPILVSSPSTHHQGFFKRGRLWPIFILFGAAKLAIQALITFRSMAAGYGHHRDEFYYLMCARRLAAGYVDNPPLVALQAWAANFLFGYRNLVGFRLLPAFGGACMVVLTGFMADALGGSRKAVALSMLAILTVPVFIATQSFLSMNAWDPVFWMGAVYAMLRLLKGSPQTRWWVLLGVSIGLGLENKTSALFLIAAILAAFLATPARRFFAKKGFWLACGIVIALAMPHMMWQIRNGFPTWEWLRAVQHSDKVAVLSPRSFCWSRC